jgi:hypothetical protein
MLLETGEVKDWEITDPQKIDDLGDVYAIILDPSLADASGYIINEDDEQITVYLEKAPEGQNLYLNHTYLHLIFNTENNDEVYPEGNDTTTDVYLDFTEIMGAGAMSELV